MNLISEIEIEKKKRISCAWAKPRLSLPISGFYPAQPKLPSPLPAHVSLGRPASQFSIRVAHHSNLVTSLRAPPGGFSTNLADGRNSIAASSSAANELRNKLKVNPAVSAVTSARVSEDMVRSSESACVYKSRAPPFPLATQRRSFHGGWLPARSARPVLLGELPPAPGLLRRLPMATLGFPFSLPSVGTTSATNSTGIPRICRRTPTLAAEPPRSVGELATSSTAGENFSYSSAMG